MQCAKYKHIKQNKKKKKKLNIKPLTNLIKGHRVSIIIQFNNSKKICAQCLLRSGLLLFINKAVCRFW